MLIHTIEERLALLLSVLGTEASTAAFKSMNPTRAKYVGQLLTDYQADPPSREEVEYVINDFNKYFSFAMDALGPQIKEAGKNKKSGSGTSGGSDTTSRAPAEAEDQTIYFPEVDSTGDVVADLNRLNPFQVAAALENDHPKTIALVLRKLAIPLAAAVLENLPESVRTDSVVYLSQESTIPQPIVEQVLLSAFDKANSVRCKKQEVKVSEGLAELMRSLPKDMRKELFERLTIEDPELVEEIRLKLYVFDDLLRIDDRDMQKVLGEIETDILIVGLQKADPELIERLLNNLSKRARQTIKEEMQYKVGVPQEEIDQARQKLVDTIGRLDEEGDITLN